MKNYPLERFRQEVYDAIVKHPFITKTWVTLNRYDDLKKAVITHGDYLPAGYKCIIQTADNIMGSKEYGRNTGKIDEFFQKMIGKEREYEDFQIASAELLRLSAEQKKPLTVGDLEKLRAERPLTEEEKQRARNYIEKEVIPFIEKGGSVAEKRKLLQECREQVLRKRSIYSRAFFR
jgi:hypothetical protein